MLRKTLFTLLVLVVIGAALVYVQTSLRSPVERLGQDRPYDLRVGTRFSAAHAGADVSASLKRLELPQFPGANSVWGATGRDDRGHIWVGVSVQGEDGARLVEYIPGENRFVDHGDPVTALKSAGLYREGATQRKIHSKIIQADDGYLYFSSTDEQGELGDGSRLPTWGSHLWRLKPGKEQWEHLFATPEGLVAVSGVGRWIYALGYWGHVLYQYDTHTGEVASVRVGSVGGHVSRNFVVDVHGNAYVPRVELIGDVLVTFLVQFNTALREVSASPLTHYAGEGNPNAHHGIVGLSYLADDSIIVVTGVGYAYQIVPAEHGPARVEGLGWFHPEGSSYTAAVFPVDGQTTLLGVGRRRGSGYALIEYDIAERSSREIELDVPDLKFLLLYGSNTRDDQGNFYLVGRHDWEVPLAWQLVLSAGMTPAGVASVTETARAASGPIPEPIAVGDISVVLEDVAQVPLSTGGPPPKTRINYLYHANDGSGRLFVNDMRGQIYIIKAGVLLAEPFLNLAQVVGEPLVAKEFELGLGSFAFHPDFARSGEAGFGKVYTLHTENESSVPQDSSVRVLSGSRRPTHHFDVITEWSVSAADADKVDPASRREVVRIAQPWWDHNAGLLAFDPNAHPGDADYGLLYIGVGDGGNTANRKLEIDHDRQGQDLSSPLGKILRIDPLRHGSQQYSVRDAPFAGRGGVLDEVWAYGLRNPQRFSWDTGGTGTMLIADIGQDRVEEINVGVAGANYEWSFKEGSLPIERSDGSGSSTPGGQTMGPVLEYDHDEGEAVTGGFVYRGNAIPELVGMYVFGDILKGRVFYASVDELRTGKPTRIRELGVMYNDKRTNLQEIAGNSWRADLRFGMDQDGEIYTLTKQDGWIRKLTRAPGAAVAVRTREVAAATAPSPGAPGVESLPVDEPQRDDSGLMLAVWVAAGAGAVVLLLSAIVLLRTRESSVLSAHQRTRRGDGSGQSTSTRENHAIEVFESDQVLKLADHENGGVREVGFADVAGFEIRVNDTSLLSVSRDSLEDFGRGTLATLRNALLAVQEEHMTPDSVRRVDLDIQCQTESPFTHTMNVYYRRGNRRMTRRSYSDMVEDVVHWCGRLASVLGSNPVTETAHGDEPDEQNAPVAAQAQAVDAQAAARPAEEHPVVEKPVAAEEPRRAAQAPTPEGPSVADELDKLVRLFEQGFLSEEEFQQAKKKLLDR